MDAAETRIDLMSDTLAQDPWAELRALRERAPVAWHTDLKRWIVTSDRALRTVVSDYRRFTVEGTSMADLFGVDAFISTDDRARHDPLRGVWATAFRTTGVEPLRAVIQAMCDSLLAPLRERLLSGEAVDLTHGFCRALPTMVIAHMMGVPEDMIPEVVEWSDAMAARGPAYMKGDHEAVRVGEAAKVSLADYLSDLLDARRRDPGDDLISAVAQADAARGLSNDQIGQNTRQLLFAGNETTARWLAHIFLTYGQQPQVRDELARDRSLIPAANDEVLRWQGVVGTGVRRVRGGSVELGGVRLQDGDLITCVLTAATRDPARFENPDRFDIHRPSEPHVGFGMGLHHCLGINLAKLEAQIAVNRLLDAVGPYEIAGPFRYTAIPMRGPHPVIVRLAGRPS